MNTQIMPKVAVNTTANSANAAQGTGKGANGGQAEFMQTLQAMLYGQTSTKGSDLQASLQDMLADDADKQGAENGAQLIAQMLALDPGLASMLPMLLTAEGGASSGNITQMLSALQADTQKSTDIAQLIAGLTNTAQNGEAELMAALTGSTQPNAYENLLAQLTGNNNATATQAGLSAAQADTVNAASADGLLQQAAGIQAGTATPQAAAAANDNSGQKALPEAQLNVGKQDMAQDEAQQLAQGNASFAKAVASAKENASGDTKEQQAQHGGSQADAKISSPTDKPASAKQTGSKGADDSEKSVDAGRAEGTFASKLAQPIDRAQGSAPPAQISKQALLEQVTKGAVEKANAGQEDFTLKLSPEGLGDITVKLAHVNGRITMQLTASDTNVQRLLASELDVLKEAMKPYKVEVQEVRSQEQQHFNFEGNAQDAQQQHSELAARFAFAKEQRDNSAQYYYSDTLSAADKADSPMAATRTLAGSAIDRYI